MPTSETHQVSTGAAPCGARRYPARRGEGDRLRGEILTAALRLLGESGDIGALSLRAVAREVGVAATSIYLHFPDLEALLWEVKTELFDELFRSQQQAAGAAGDNPVHRVYARAHGYLRFAADRPGHYRILFQSRMLRPGHRQDQTSFVGAEAFEALRSDVASIVGEASAFMVSLHLWTAMHGMVMLRSDRRNFPWPELDDELNDLVARLIGTPPRP